MVGGCRRVVFAKPLVNLNSKSKYGGAFSCSHASNWQVFVPFPSLQGAHTSIQVRGDLFPRVQDGSHNLISLQQPVERGEGRHEQPV